MDDKQLFSIIVYKNICPKAYSELQKDSGNIINILKNKKSRMQKLIKELSDKKEELNEKKENVENESLTQYIQNII